MGVNWTKEQASEYVNQELTNGTLGRHDPGLPPEPRVVIYSGRIDGKEFEVYRTLDGYQLGVYFPKLGEYGVAFTIRADSAVLWLALKSGLIEGVA